MKRVKIAIVGTRFITNLHLAAYEKIDPSKFTVVEAASKVPQNARDFAAHYDIAMADNSFEAMIADPEIDVVDICTPNDHIERLRLYGFQILVD